MGVRIDALDATAVPSRLHEVPAMKDGLTVKLTVGQILDLIIDSAPGALDTLNELAAALGDDANFATTVTNALALKAPLASPALTGNPTAPTPSPGDNDTSIATTAFVTAAVAAGSSITTGTFTPGFSFGGGSTGLTYTTQSGRYAKIGTRVFFSLRVTISNAGSSTGNMAITGLPFTASGLDCAASVGFAQNFASLTGAFMPLVSIGGTTISMRQSAATGQANVTNSNVTNTADIIMSGFYETT